MEKKRSIHLYVKKKKMKRHLKCTCSRQKILAMPYLRVLITMNDLSNVDLRWNGNLFLSRIYLSLFFFPFFISLFHSLSLFLSLTLTLPLSLSPYIKKNITFRHFPFFLNFPSVVPFGPHYQHDYSLLHRKMLVSTMISFWIASMPAVRSVSPLDSLND